MRRHDEPPRAGHRAAGFTLIELLAILVILGILAVTAITKYQSMQADGRKQGARNLIASAQSQLSLDYGRRVLAGLSLTEASQATCNLVISTSADITASVTCTGNLDGTVVIDAVYDTYAESGVWTSPLASGT